MFKYESAWILARNETFLLENDAHDSIKTKLISKLNEISKELSTKLITTDQINCNNQ
jgi:hypothetical protein